MPSRSGSVDAGTAHERTGSGTRPTPCGPPPRAADRIRSVVPSARTRPDGGRRRPPRERRTVNLYLRLLLMHLTARRRGRLGIWDTARTAFRVRPHDLDLFGHVNNGRYLTIMDVARLDLLVRSGLWSRIRARGWYPVVAGQNHHLPPLPHPRAAVRRREPGPRHARQVGGRRADLPRRGSGRRARGGPQPLPARGRRHRVGGGAGRARRPGPRRHADAGLGRRLDELHAHDLTRRAPVDAGARIRRAWPDAPARGATPAAPPTCAATARARGAGARRGRTRATPGRAGRRR